jgi:hypothetical protein
MEKPDEIDSPSLFTLQEFINNEAEYINDANMQTDVITEYMDACNKDGYYYLYGQIKMYQCVPITLDLLEESIDVNTKRIGEYGGPCNSFEAASIERSKQLFEMLINWLHIYYAHKLRGVEKNDMV